MDFIENEHKEPFIDNNVDLQNISKIEENLKKFDLNDHLFNFLNKINFQDEKESKRDKYCLSCKIFFDQETSDLHFNHDVIDHTKDLKNIQFINELFEKLETKFFNNFTNDIDNFDEILSNQIGNSIGKLVELLNTLKASKMEDLENFKANHKKNFSVLKKNFFDLKFKFSNFYKKNDIFLNVNNNTNNNHNGTLTNNPTVQNLLNTSISNLNHQLCSNPTTTSLHGNGTKNKLVNKITKDNKILNDVFYLINFDINRQIENTEKKLELFLESEKSKMKSQADELEKIISEFTSQINTLKEEKKLNKVNLDKTIYCKNSFPDFTQALHLRLIKYSEIFDKLNFTMMDIKNSNSYKKMEGLIGNLESDILNKMAHKNYVPGKSDKFIFNEMLNEVDFVDPQFIEEDTELNNPGFLSVKNKDNQKLKQNLNLVGNRSSFPNFKSKSDTKDQIENKSQINILSQNSEFDLFNTENANLKSNKNLNANDSNGKHKKNISFNLKNINLGNGSNSKTASMVNLENNDANQNFINTQSSKINLHSNQTDGCNTSTIKDNNMSVLNTSMLNKSSFWRNKDDLIKKYLILSLMGTYDDIQEIEEENENGNVSHCERALQDSNYLSNTQDPIVAKVVENTNEILIYDKKTFSITKQRVNLNREIHGVDCFPDGCRTVLANDKLYITGGRDVNQYFTYCYEYDIKLNYIKKIQSMKNPRAYHTLIFNGVLMKLFVIGGENNKTCEEYDLYRSKWESLPDLNIHRAYANCIINKTNNIIYAFFGVKGEITKDNFTDAVEILNLDKKENGWVKVDYINKCDINLKTKYVQVFPIESDKLLVVGNCISRYNNRNFAVYDLKIDHISKIDSRLFLEIRRKSKQDPALKKLLNEINKSLK